MKQIFTYGVALLMLLTFLVNSQGIIVEHHNCDMCQPETCHVENVSLLEEISEEKDCSVAHTCCSLPNLMKEEYPQAALYQFESCTCFAEYIQLPVFQSEITNYKIALEENQFFWTFLHIKSNTKANVEKPLKIDQTPPLDLYKEVQQHIVNCTFLI